MFVSMRNKCTHACGHFGSINMYALRSYYHWHGLQAVGRSTGAHIHLGAGERRVLARACKKGYLCVRVRVCVYARQCVRARACQEASDNLVRARHKIFCTVVGADVVVVVVVVDVDAVSCSPLAVMMMTMNNVLYL